MFNTDLVIQTSGFALTAYTLLVWFINAYVLISKDHLIVLSLSCYSVFSSYFVIHYFLLKLSSKYTTYSTERQFYILSNLIKSATLAMCVPASVQVLLGIVYTGEWPDVQIKNLGSIYAATDLVSIGMLKQMHLSTRLHHVSVVILNFVNLCNEYSKFNVCRLIVMYAMFSMLSYLVNCVLAIRFLVPKRITDCMCRVSFGIYATCCLVNWILQIYYLKQLFMENDERLIVYGYSVLICFLMWDDAVLIKWLAVSSTNYKSKIWKNNDGFKILNFTVRFCRGGGRCWTNPHV